MLCKYFIVSGILYLFTCNSVYGQNLVIRGFVKSVDHIPIAAASVIAYDKDNQTLDFSVCDSNGRYMLSLNSIDTTINISVSALGYYDTILPMHIYSPKNSEIVKDVVLLERHDELEEIVVNTTIEEDSVGFRIDSLGLSESSNLEEVLSKVSGFRIGEDGSIAYNGKSINKINVNGKQVFIQQNKVALSSIEKRMIDHLAIINNFKDNFEIGFEDRKETVLNIATKDSFSNRIVGDASGGGGINNKYKISETGLYFSKYFNSFLIHNTNNIGESNLTQSEINGMFSENMPYSDLQQPLVYRLLETNESKNKSFRSNSIATIRKETPNFKFNTSLTYINNISLSSTTTQNFNSLGNRLSYMSLGWNDKTKGLLHSSSISYRPSYKMVLSYRIITNFIDGSRLGNNVNTFYVGETGKKDSLFSNSVNNSKTISNELKYSLKISNNLLLNADYGYHYMKFYAPTDITHRVSGSSIDKQLSSLNEYKNHFALKMSYKISKYAIPWINFDNDLIISRINNTMNLLNNLFKRPINQSKLGLGLAGDKYLNITYGGELEFLFINSNSKKQSFCPYDFHISYEKDLSRIYVEGSRKYNIADISKGISLIRDYNIWDGDISLLNNVKQINNYALGYARTNLFKGTSYGFNANYSKRINDAIPSFDYIDDDGIQHYQIRLIPRYMRISSSIYGNINIFPRSFPVKTDLMVEYPIQRYEGYFQDNLKNIYTRGPRYKIGLQTLNSGRINIIIVSDFLNYKTTIDEQPLTQKELSFRNRVSLKYRANSDFETNVHFIHNTNRLNGQTYNRNSINIDAEKRFKRIVVGIKAQNIENFFSPGKNLSYNSFVSYDQGITTITNFDQAIHYAILFAKIRF